jgi:hypothetical protein
MRPVDEQYTRTPFYGIRRMTAWLKDEGHRVNHKRVARLDGDGGAGCYLSQAPHQPTPARSPSLPLPAEGRRAKEAGPGLEHGHPLHPDE